MKVVEETDREGLVAEGNYRIPEAAEFAKLSKSYLYGAMERGELKYLQVGRARRIPKAELRRYLARHLKG